MPYDAIAISNALLDIAQERGALDVTPMKLQKLVFFAHGWNLAVTNTPLINEQIEAWRYGPVVDSIYHAAKRYGNSPITGKLQENPWCIPELSDNEKSSIAPLLTWIWDQYGKYTGTYLSNLTHEEGSPWDTVIKQELATNRFVPRGTDIPEDIIRNYFLGVLKSQQPQSAS